MKEQYDKVRAIEFFDFKKLIRKLEASGFIGPIYFLGHIIRGCIVPFETIFKEATYHLSKLINLAHFEIEPITSHQFKRILEDDGIIVHPTAEHLEKLKGKTLRMAHLDQRLLEQLAERLDVSQNNLVFDDAKGRWIIKGKRGHLYAERTADSFRWMLVTKARSKRHFSSVRRQLSFMSLASQLDLQAEFMLDRLPIGTELPVIRKVAGLNKSPTLSDERKIQLRNRANAMRGLPPNQKMGVSSSAAL